MKTAFLFLIMILYDNRAEVPIPNEVICDLARFFLPGIIAFFESEEGRAEF